MTDQNHDTKTKILEVARLLFADQGFEGTSIREIAKAADVNIASVNYHFNNKENLFNEMFFLVFITRKKKKSYKKSYKKNYKKNYKKLQKKNYKRYY